MNTVSKSRVSETMGVHVPKRIARLIEARAEAIGHKKSRYAAMIVEWWAAQGAPAINRVDETMRAEVMDQVAAKNKQAQVKPDTPVSEKQPVAAAPALESATTSKAAETDDAFLFPPKQMAAFVHHAKFGATKQNEADYLLFVQTFHARFPKLAPEPLEGTRTDMDMLIFSLAIKIADAHQNLLAPEDRASVLTALVGLIGSHIKRQNPLVFMGSQPKPATAPPQTTAQEKPLLP